MPEEELPSLKLFNSLARMYLQRELLINKITEGRELTLTKAERIVNGIIEDPYLLRLIEMLDRFFLIRRKDSVSIVKSYRYRLSQFVNKTIGLENFVSLLQLRREELENALIKEKENLLKRKNEFPILEAQLAILLKWHGG
ncbi:MAG: hypothetical protein ACP5IT_07495 [Thermoproteota archaeon]